MCYVCTYVSGKLAVSLGINYIGNRNILKTKEVTLYYTSEVDTDETKWMCLFNPS